MHAQLQHIDQAIQGGINDLPQKLDGVIVCVGIGARFLGGIEDKGVFPIRGQTIALKAPWIRYGRTLSKADGSYTYLMPKANGDVSIHQGEQRLLTKLLQVLIGGIKVAHDW